VQQKAVQQKAVQQKAVQQKAVQQKVVQTSVQKEVKQGVQKGVRQHAERQKGVRQHAERQKGVPQQEEPVEDHQAVHQEHQTERQQGVHQAEQYTEKQTERKLYQAVQQQEEHQQAVQQQGMNQAVQHLRQGAQETNQLQLEQQGEKQVSTVQMSNSQRYSFCTIKSEILASNSNTILQNIWMKYDHFPHCSDNLREETVDLSAKSPLWHPRHSSHPKSPQPYVSFAIVSDQFNGCNKTKGPTFKIAMPMYYSERYVRQTLKALLEKTTGIIGSVCIIASTIVYECICCAYILFNRMGWLHCDRRVGS
jgi:hypothetical protein